MSAEGASRRVFVVLTHKNVNMYLFYRTRAQNVYRLLILPENKSLALETFWQDVVEGVVRGSEPLLFAPTK